MGRGDTVLELRAQQYQFHDPSGQKILFGMGGGDFMP
jgi:hypothetical protein